MYVCAGRHGSTLAPHGVPAPPNLAHVLLLLLLLLPLPLAAACRAKRIEVSVARNEIMDQSSLIARYQQEIQLLRGQLELVMRERER